MILSRRRVSVALLSLAAAPTLARAETYPSHPIRIVVPAGPGGITDIVARIVGQRLSERLGQPVIVDNKSGASGIIGTEVVARSAPDGYTLLMVYPSHPVNPALKQHLPYDTIKDFVGVTTLTTVSLVLMVPPSLAAKSVQELIALSRKERLTYASVGSGSLAHLGAELFRSMAGIELTHVPYRSAPAAQQALMGGEVSMFFDTPITAVPWSGTGGCARSASAHRSAQRCCPTCRPSPRPACPAMSCWAGTAFLRRRRPRSRSCRS